MALVGALLTLGPPAFAQGEKTVRAVMHAEVKWVDPHWTTANITQQHAYMIYETLFALDAKGNPRPQMVDTFRMSPDKLTYTFVLRNGLKWHDGQPVRAIDAVASLKRWAVKDAAGQKLMAKTASLEATDDKTLVLKLKEPYGLVLRALAKEYSYVPFIIPERQAVQPADKAFEGDKIGSGPFIFSEKEWVPGAKTVYLRNKDYVPRTDPPDYYAGARRATVDRVEWVVIPDPSTAVAALQKGEVDFIQQPHIDQWPILRKDPNVTMKKVDVEQMQIHPNHLAPPFDNVKARQALALHGRPARLPPGDRRRPGELDGLLDVPRLRAVARHLRRGRALREAGPRQGQAAAPGGRVQGREDRGDGAERHRDHQRSIAHHRGHAPEARRERRSPGHGLGDADVAAPGEGPAEQEPRRLAHLPHDVQQRGPGRSVGSLEHLDALRARLVRLALLAPCLQGARRAREHRARLAGVQESSSRSTTPP